MRVGPEEDRSQSSMTYPPSDPAGSELPPGVEISFREGLTAEQKETAQRSVAALVTRAEQASAARLARARHVAALSASLANLVKADPEAAQALEALRDPPTDDGEPAEDPPAAAMRSASGASLAIEKASILDSVDIRSPPYDFAWRWHHQAGSAPIGSFTNADGYVGLDARSGSIASGASTFVDAHAGYGLALSTPHQVTVTGHSLRKTWHSYVVGCTGVGGDATSEGGMEFTAMENGQFLTAASHKLWRRRVSGLESDRFRSDGFYPLYDPSELAFTMFPNRQYTFNVGIWAFSDRSPGAGVAWAQSLIEADVWLMTIQRP